MTWCREWHGSDPSWWGGVLGVQESLHPLVRFLGHCPSSCLQPPPPLGCSLCSVAGDKDRR